MEHSQPRREWVVKRQLSPEALKQYVARFEVDRAQVVAITEHQDGVFTLIFEPTEAQHQQLAAEEGQVAETLDTLFGASVIPAQAPSEEPETVVAIPVGPLVAPPTAPSAEPSPS